MSSLRTWIVLLILLLWSLGPRPALAQPRLDPEHTRAFVVSLTRFAGGKGSPWEKGRQDYEFIKLLKQWGLSEDHILFLADEEASSEHIRTEFVRFLQQSQPGETLFFYFGSHGGYNPKKGTYWYVSYDGDLPFEWAFEALEKNFRGSQVLMTADTCYSGGIVEIARRRQSRLAYACLSSTYAHNVGYSGWRFLDCLMRGFRGVSVLDQDGDGYVELEELAAFAQRHMAFVAEGYPTFYTSPRYPSRLVLAQDDGPRKPPPVGRYVEALHDDDWLKAEIVDARKGQVCVHLTDKNQNFTGWVSDRQVRPYEFDHFEPGAAVEVEDDDQWYPAHVEDSFETLHFCSMDNRSRAYDWWVGPSQIRVRHTASNLSGHWTGTYENSAGETGDDSLDLTEDADGNLSGLWTDTIHVSGRRTGEKTARLTARTKTRAYDFQVALQGDELILNYTAQRLNSSGSYSGRCRLSLPEAGLSGHWTGTYENSAGETGDDSLDLAVDEDGNLSGVWSGNIPVKGKQLDGHNARLAARTRTRSYQFELILQGPTLVMKYTAQRLDSGGSYSGQCRFTQAP